MLSVFRSPKNPLLAPSRGRSFEALGAFNPSIVEQDKTFHVFYRAMAEPDALRTPGRGFSTIGYAASPDPENFEHTRQLISATEPWEQFGLEDPRATFFEGTWYVFYTALGGFPFGPDNIKVACAFGDAPTNLSQKRLITPFNAKAATLFPERINGEVVLLLTAHTDWTAEHPRPTIGIARAKEVSDFFEPSYWEEWHAHLSEHAFPDVRRADSEHMELGATPVRIPEGWLLIYSHIQNYYDEPRRIFGVEALLLDAAQPEKILSKTAFPFLVPEESYERYGIVANVTFPTGAHVLGDSLRVYYGAADTVSALATLSLRDLLQAMNPEVRERFVARASDTPLLSPIPEHPWEARGVLNPAAIDLGGSVHLLYRAVDPQGISRLGYARLADALHVDERLSEPVYVPRTPEESKGTEDPRIVALGDTLYLTYTAFDGVHETRGALATLSTEKFLAKDFSWSAPHLITPAGVNDKDVCLAPELIDGEYLVIHRIEPSLSIDLVNSLASEHTVTQSLELIAPRPGMWDARKVGAGAPPIRVPEGWLLIYHGIGEDHVYRLGALLLDGETASTVRARSALPIMSPLLPWERLGEIGNVVFTCGVVLREDTLYIYYGAADSAVGVATLSLSTLMQKLLPKL